MSEYDENNERDNSDLQDYEIEVNEPPVDQFVPKVPLVEKLMAFLYKRDQKRLTDGINTGAKDKKPKSMGNMSAGMTIRSIRASIIEGIGKINRAIVGSNKQTPKETLTPTTMAKFDQEKAMEKMRSDVTPDIQVDKAPEQANRIFPKGVDTSKSSVVPNPSTNLTSRISEAVNKYNAAAEKAEAQAPTVKVEADGTTVSQKTVVDANGNTYGRVVPGPLGGIKAKEATVAAEKPEAPAPKVEAKPGITAEKISVNKAAVTQDKEVKLIKPEDVGKETKQPEEKKKIVNPILGNIERED